MKRLLFSLFALLASVGMWAQTWTAPDAQTYPMETPVYVKVNVNGDATTSGLEVAAFIGDECRASVSTPFRDLRGNTAYRLYVRGTESDLDKDITFKVLHNGVVYGLSTTAVFDGETSVTPSKAKTLNIDAPTGVKVTNPLTIEKKVPFEYNLLDKDVTFEYKNAAGNAYTPKKESTIESTITYIWNAGNSVAYFTVDNKSILKGLKYVGGTPLELTVIADKSIIGDTYTEVSIVEPKVMVTGMTLTKYSIEVNKGDDVYSMIRKMVTITPSDASNKDVTISLKEATITNPFPNGYASEYGTYTLVVTANGTAQGTTVSKEISVKVLRPVSFTVPREINVSEFTANTLQFTNQTGDNYDASKVSVAFEVGNGGSMYVSGSGLKWNLSVTDDTRMRNLYNVYYDGTLIGSGTALLLGEMRLANGWNWFSPKYVDPQMRALYLVNYTNSGIEYKDFVVGNDDSKILEVRSQLDLLYNDPEWGMFGDIQYLSPDSMYKIKVVSPAGPITISLGTACSFGYIVDGRGLTVKKGYNWIGLPIHGYRTASELDLWGAQQGDMLIGKDGFAEYDGNSWSFSAGFTVEAGKGYMYYTEAVSKNLNCSTYVSRPNGMAAKQVRNARKKSVFEFDASRFADNMAMTAEIAALKGKEGVAVGAFVGDECRGMGELTADGKLMICVAGKAGEKVNFRVYDAEEGEFIQLNETVNFTQKMGSLKAPVRLTGDMVETAICDVKGAQSADEEIYDLAGRRVQNAQKGVFVVNGRKVMK